MAEAKKTAKPVATDDLASAVHGIAGRDQGIVDPLMVPFVMIVLHELGDRSSEIGFAEWHYPVQALGPNGQHEPLRKGLQSPLFALSAHALVALEVVMLKVEIGPTWNVGDLFVSLYDKITPRAPELLEELDVGSTIRSALDPALSPLIREIRQEQGSIPRSMKNELASLVSAGRALEMLLAIDEAFHSFGRQSTSWLWVRHLLKQGTYQSDVSSTLAPCFPERILLPRWLPSADEPQAGRGELAGRLNWLRLVPRERTVAWRQLSDDEDLPHDLSSIRIGVVPLLNRNDVAFRRHVVRGKPFFYVRTLVDDKVVLRRLQQAVIRCERHGVDVLFAPELSCTERIWDRLADFLASLPTRTGDGYSPKPKWLILGTALVAVNADGIGTNRARVLAVAPTACRLWEQDKLNPYAMSLKERRRYDLTRVLGKTPAMLPEAARPGRAPLWLVDSRILGRMAITICEDLAQPPAGLAARLGASLLFAPVMDGPLLATRWAGIAAQRLFHDQGCRVVVANSLVLPQRAHATAPRRYPEPHGFALCSDFLLRPKLTIRRARRADDEMPRWTDWSFELDRRT